MGTGGVEGRAVMVDIGIGVGERLLEALELDRGNLVAACYFQRVEQVLRAGESGAGF